MKKPLILPMNDILVSDVPGRIRLRGALLRQPALLASLTHALQSLPGMFGVQANARVGSLLLVFDVTRLSRDEIGAQLAPMLEQARGSAQPSGRDQSVPVEPVAGRARAAERAATASMAASGQPSHHQGAGQAARQPDAISRGGDAPASTGRGFAFWRRAPAREAQITEQAGDQAVSGRPGSAGVRARPEGVLAGRALTAERTRAARPRAGRFRKQLNRVSKGGMLLSLGTSLGLAATGAKRGHIYSGGAFVALLAGHLWTHRKHLLK